MMYPPPDSEARKDGLTGWTTLNNGMVKRTEGKNRLLILISTTQYALCFFAYGT
jgi:hypothetical protein